MDFTAFDDFDFGSVELPNICVRCASSVCLCPTQACDSSATTSDSPSFASGLLAADQFSLPWGDSPFPTYDLQALSSRPSVSPVSFDVSTTAATPITDYSSPRGFDFQNVESQQYCDSYDMVPRPSENCSCLREALLVSEQLHYNLQTIDSLAFDEVLSIARKGIRVCEQYLKCQRCMESLNSILCLDALRRASECYKHLATTKNSFEGADSRIFRCHVGLFEADAVLDEDVCRAILRSEIQRATRSATELERLLQSGTLKGTSNAMDEITLQYHQGVVSNVMKCLHEAQQVATG